MNSVWTGERLETFVFEETTLEHLHRYALALDFAKGKKVLDVACGEGYGSNLLAEVAENVVGIDIDEATITKAIDKYRKRNLCFRQGSATKLPCEENEFDVVVSFETIEHISDHDQMLHEIKRVLKPKGILIISTPDKKNYSDERNYRNKYHIKELYKKEFTGLVSRYFRNQKLFQQSFVHASLLIGDDTTMTSYTGGYEKILQGFPKPFYWVLLASDEKLSTADSSIFFNDNFLSTVLQKEADEIKKSLTYKVGLFILRPLKWFLSFFRS